MDFIRQISSADCFSFSILELTFFFYVFFVTSIGGHESWWTSISSNDGCSTAALGLRLGQVQHIGSQITAGVAQWSKADAHGTVRDLDLHGMEMSFDYFLFVLKSDALLGSQAEQFVNLPYLTRTHRLWSKTARTIPKLTDAIKTLFL